MEIRSSIEVRWFVDDASAEAKAARAWFRDVAPQSKREDHYLLTGRNDVGFKARVEEGLPAKLETKFLLGSLGPALLHERFVGHIERWRKLASPRRDVCGSSPTRTAWCAPSTSWTIPQRAAASR